MIFGSINISFSEGSAASFSLSLISGNNPLIWLDKEIKLSYQSADNQGILSILQDQSIFIGKIREAIYNAEEGTMTLSGYDYGGVQNNLGEFHSGNLNVILEGDIYINAAGVYITGFNPIWDVSYTGSGEIEDGVDYFVDTLNGKIYVPFNSRLISTPAALSFKYANYFTNINVFLQAIATIKGWTLEFDNITIPDYSTIKNQPIITISNESIIDILKTLIEIGGGKIDTSLFPLMRIYSEKNNITASEIKIFTESEIFENSFSVSASWDNLLTKQAVKSAIKTFTNVEVSALLEQDRDEGSEFLFVQGYFSAQYTNYDNMLAALRYHTRLQLDAATFEVIGEATFSVEDVLEFAADFIFSVSDLSGTGFFHEATTPLPFGLKVESVINTEAKTITYKILRPFYRVYVYVQNDSYKWWNHEGWDFIYMSLAFKPFATWTLIFNTKKLSYGDEITTQQVEVTGTQTIEGIATVLAGDVFEHAYIETTAQATALVDAVLVNRGVPYKSSCEVPLHAFGNLRIGDKVRIQSRGKVLTGLLETIDYNIDVDNAEATVSISTKGKSLN